MGYVSIERVQPHILKRDWGEEIIVTNTPKYLGKVLRMKAGTAGGLQLHVEKDETFHLYEGTALVVTDDGTGQLTWAQMLPGDTCHVPPGAVHQVRAITDCTFFECSTVHFDDRVRCEERYGLTVDGGLPTTRDDRGERIIRPESACG
jgi:mannose-6-phosphate isomerase-like protein (cupin superfamily)